MSLPRPDLLMIRPYSGLGLGVVPGYTPLLTGALFRITGYHTGDFCGELLPSAPGAIGLEIFKVIAVETGSLERGQTVEVNRRFANFQRMEKVIREEAPDLA